MDTRNLVSFEFQILSRCTLATPQILTMKKRVAFSRLGRSTTHKWAMLRNMVTSLIKHERIVTTVPKAKELRHLADQMVTLAKSSDSRQLSAIREANKVIREKPVLTKLFQVLGPRYKERQGGYTRVLKLSKRRAGDNAEMAVMEYVDRPGELRAARPPTSVQQEVMAQYIKHTLGIDPVLDDQGAGLEDKLEELDLTDDNDHEAKPPADVEEAVNSEEQGKK